MKKIILASDSPRRKELLQQAGIEFDVVASNYEEKLDTRNFDYKSIEDTAYNKALCVSKKINEKAVIIGADTVVVLNNLVLTKPKTRSEAIDMLKALSCTEHKVVTSICIIDSYSGEVKIKSDTTLVRFKNLDDEKITNYVDTYKPYDKAGAYGIQELPEGFVDYINGNIENVIGLCTETVKMMLND